MRDNVQPFRPVVVTQGADISRFSVTWPPIPAVQRNGSGSDTCSDANVKGMCVTALTTPHGRAPARAVAVLLVAAAAALVLAHRFYQGVELALARLASPSVHIGQLGSSAQVLVPLLLFSSVLVALSPRITRKTVVAVGWTFAALVACDQLTVWLGPSADVFGGVAAVVLFCWLTVRRERP